MNTKPMRSLSRAADVRNADRAFFCQIARAHLSSFYALSKWWLPSGFLVVWLAAPLDAASVVRTDQAVYNVLPNETFQIDVLIDQDDATLGNVYEPLPNGLFSYGFQLSYPLGQGTIPSIGDIAPATPLDFFGFSVGSMKQVTPNSARIKGNIDQNANTPYGGSLLAQFQFTNLAPVSSSYFIDLDEWRTLGVNEQIFLDGTGIVLDTVPSTDLFRRARINVVPEPQGIGVLWLMWGAHAIYRSGRSRHRAAAGAGRSDWWWSASRRRSVVGNCP